MRHLILHSRIRRWLRHSLFLALGCIFLVGQFACRNADEPTVVVYTSQDQVYAEPILKQFSALTGIQVKPVYDSEAVKTVGLANRLLAEKQNPQCDIFWNNEALRTYQLAAQGVFRQSEPWYEIGYRSRRIVINTNLISSGPLPQSYEDLTNATWRGKIALAYPLFGTTSTHFQALRQHWGEPRWIAWCRNLEKNAPLLVDGNSVVVKLVGKGEAWIGLTDSDDIAAGQREGLPIKALDLDECSLLIPNTVAIIQNARNPNEAQELADYLRMPATIARLVAANALEGTSFKDAGMRTLNPNYRALVEDLEPTTAKLKEIFLR